MFHSSETFSTDSDASTVNGVKPPYRFQHAAIKGKGGIGMAGQAIEPLFNQMYDETSQKVLIYITSKCGNPSDIQDIFQETYTELFSF